MENLTPLTRLEQFLAKIAGDDIELPEVKTRLEYWLKEISENGGGGGGGSSGLIANGVWSTGEVDGWTYNILTFPNAGTIVNTFKSGGRVVLHIPSYSNDDFSFDETWDSICYIEVVDQEGSLVTHVVTETAGTFTIDESTDSLSVSIPDGDGPK